MKRNKKQSHKLDLFFIPKAKNAVDNSRISSAKISTEFYIIPWFSTLYIHLSNGKPWSCIPQLKNSVDTFPFRFPTHWPKSAAVEPLKPHRRDALKVGKSISWEAAVRDISEIAPGWFPETKTHVASEGRFQKRWPSKCSGCPFLGDMWIECWLLIVFGDKKYDGKYHENCISTWKGFLLHWY